MQQLEHCSNREFTCYKRAENRQELFHCLKIFVPTLYGIFGITPLFLRCCQMFVYRHNKRTAHAIRHKGTAKRQTIRKHEQPAQYTRTHSSLALYSLKLAVSCDENKDKVQVYFNMSAEYSFGGRSQVYIV